MNDWRREHAVLLAEWEREHGPAPRGQAWLLDVDDAGAVTGGKLVNLAGFAIPVPATTTGEADAIVRALAERKWVYDSLVCFHCDALVAADGTMDEPHDPECVYGRALAYVAANPDPRQSVPRLVDQADGDEGGPA